MIRKKSCVSSQPAWIGAEIDHGGQVINWVDGVDSDFADVKDMWQDGGPSVREGLCRATHDTIPTSYRRRCVVMWPAR